MFLSEWIKRRYIVDVLEPQALDEFDYSDHIFQKAIVFSSFLLFSVASRVSTNEAAGYYRTVGSIIKLAMGVTFLVCVKKHC